MKNRSKLTLCLNYLKGSSTCSASRNLDLMKRRLASKKMAGSDCLSSLKEIWMVDLYFSLAK